jgi:hypothetical protein
MIAEAQEKQFQTLLDDFIHEEQIVIDVAFTQSLEPPFQRMISERNGQWFSLLQRQ